MAENQKPWRRARAYLTTAQVAAELSYSVRTFYNKRGWLRERGFPEPAVGINRWDPEDIAAWRTGRRVYAAEDQEAAKIEADRADLLARIPDIVKGITRPK